jgi:hypothetical protein
MRTYAVQLLRDHGTMSRGEIVRLYEADAVALVNKGVAVWCVI